MGLQAALGQGPRLRGPPRHALLLGAETPLANFEIRLDDATRPRQDPALTVAFTLDASRADPGPLKILAWTTTPWTLPSNLALAVGPDIDLRRRHDPTATRCPGRGRAGPLRR